MIVALERHAETVRELIAAGANPDYTPFSDAAPFRCETSTSSIRALKEENQNLSSIKTITQNMNSQTSGGFPNSHETFSMCRRPHNGYTKSPT
jgi:hypothetical protein